MTLVRIVKTTALVLVGVAAGWSAPVYAFTRVAPEYLARAYEPSVVYDAAKSGGLPVKVLGGREAEASVLARRTVMAIENSRLGRATPLRLDGGAEQENATNLVVLFDPAIGAGYRGVCLGTRKSKSSSLDRVMLTLCHDGVPVSSVTAINPGATDSDTPEFSAMLGQAATTVFEVRGGDMRGQRFWNHRDHRAR